MYVVGLTGGIGSGKSTVANAFASLDVSLVDADIVAREIVEPGSVGLRAVANQFGPSVLQNTGELDRRALRNIVFNDGSQRKKLESILHPLINARIQDQLATLQGPYVLLVSPLLLETSQRNLVDRILVVDCPESLQIRRTSQRDDCPPEQVRAILDAQLDRSTRRQSADDILENEDDLDALYARVRELHQLYLSLSR